MVNLNHELKQDTHSHMYGSQDIYYKIEEETVNKVSQLVKNNTPLKDIINYIAHQRNKIACDQLKDTNTKFEITTTNLEQYDKNVYLLSVFKKNGSTKEEDDKFKLQRTLHRCIELEKVYRLFGQVRSEDYNSYGLNKEKEDNTDNNKNYQTIIKCEFSQKIVDLLKCGEQNECSNFLINRSEYKSMYEEKQRLQNRRKFRNNVFNYGTVIYQETELSTLLLKKYTTIIYHTCTDNFDTIIKIIDESYKMLNISTPNEKLLSEVARIQWLLSHLMLFKRGSSSITKMLIKGILKTHNINLDQHNFDLEALTQPLFSEFQKVFISKHS